MNIIQTDIALVTPSSGCFEKNLVVIRYDNCLKVQAKINIDKTVSCVAMNLSGYWNCCNFPMIALISCSTPNQPFPNVEASFCRVDLKCSNFSPKHVIMEPKAVELPRNHEHERAYQLR